MIQLSHVLSYALKDETLSSGVKLYRQILESNLTFRMVYGREANEASIPLSALPAYKNMMAILYIAAGEFDETQPAAVHGMKVSFNTERLAGENAMLILKYTSEVAYYSGIGDVRFNVLRPNEAFFADDKNAEYLNT